MLMCADLLQKTKCLTQCLKNLSQLRWLALRPLVQMNHQTTSLALKGETSGLLCVVLPVISILTSHLHSCVTSVCLIQSYFQIFFAVVFAQKCFTHYLDDFGPDIHQDKDISKSCLSHDWNVTSLKLQPCYQVRVAVFRKGSSLS